MSNENVLCIATDWLQERFDLGRGYWTCTQDTINSFPYTFISRQYAENDFSHKQVIPYAIVFNRKGEVLSYERCGSEKRLSGLNSAGIGGHVNDSDGGNTLYSRVISGLRREINEELGIEVAQEQLTFLGMINEEETNVGHCHIGLVFKVMVESDQINYENEIYHPRWELPHLLDLSRFELWSALAIKLEQICHS